MLLDAISLLTQYILGFEGDLGPLKSSSLLAPQHRQGMTTVAYQVLLVGQAMLFLLLKIDFFAQYTLIMVSFPFPLLSPIPPNYHPIWEHPVSVSH